MNETILREVIKEYEGDKCVRVIERSFGSPDTKHSGEAAELKEAIKELDKKWVAMIDNKMEMLRKDCFAEMKRLVEEQVKAQVEPLRAQFDDLTLRSAKLRDTIIKDCTGIITAHDNELTRRVFAAESSCRSNKVALAEVRNELENRVGTIHVAGSDDAMVCVYAIRRNQFRLKWREKGKRTSRDVADRNKAIELAKEISGKLRLESGSTGHDAARDIRADAKGSGEHPAQA
jgi:hypothetical protein